MSNRSEIQKQYIQKKKAEMGETEYNRIQNEKKKMYREKVSNKSPSVCENHPEKLEELRKTFQSMSSKSGKELRPITIENYVGKINKLSVLMTGKCFDGDLKFLLNPDDVVKKLKESKLKGLKDYTSPITKLLKHFNHSSDIIQVYQKAMSDFKNEEDKVRGDNIASKKQVDNAIPLPEIQEKIKEFKPKTEQDLMYKTIMQFYFSKTGLIPRNNLIDIKISNDKKKNKDLNKEWNYLTVDANMNPKRIIMMRFKNAEVYMAKNGGQRPTFAVDPELAETLKEYIRVFGKKISDFLFTMPTTNEPYKPANFLDTIGNASEKIFGKRMTIDLIRSIWVTNHFSSGLKSINENQELANRMLNSTGIQQQYIKKNLQEEFEGDGR